MRLYRYLEEARTVRASRSKSVTSQLLDILRLRFGPGRLGPSEYYDYALFEDRFKTLDSKRSFVGWRVAATIDSRLNGQSWRAIANDKLLFYSILRTIGIPSPEIRAVFHPAGRTFPGSVSCRSPSDVERYVAETNDFPMFLKPIHGTFGRGVYALHSFDRTDSTFLLHDGSRERLSDVMNAVRADWAEGYVFQELLRPHKRLEGLCGPRLGTVRLIIGLNDGSATPIHAVWRITTGNNVADNFAHGRLGNMLGNVSLETGRVERVCRGLGLRFEENIPHPDTGETLHGVQLPDWSAAVELACRGAANFPGLRFQHWDIALTSRGPIAIEVNVEGSLDLHQVAARRGLLESALANLLSSDPAGQIEA